MAGVTLYVAAMMVVLVVQVTRIASQMQRDVDPQTFLYGDVVTRVHILTGAAYSLERLMDVGDPSMVEDVKRLRQNLAPYTREHSFPPVDQLPARTREVVLQAVAEANLLEASIFDAMAQVEQGHLTDARRRLARMDSLRVMFDAQLTRAQVAGIEELHRRQEALVASAHQALIALAVWLLVGIVGLRIAWGVVHRRLWRPLARLEEGLSQVAQGNLRVELPVQRFDEVGRLANHFNSMTDVLRERAEEQGRFAAAGQLIAGVAHEVNNPLMAIATMGETRLDDPSVPPEHRAELKHMVRQARRAGRLLSGLLRFVRADESGAEVTNLNTVCREAVDLLSYRFGHEEITLEMRLEPDIPNCGGNPAQVEQVLVNLLSNALDALTRVKPPRRLMVATTTDDSHVCVRIEDNGPGITPEARERMFLPFVSTKGRRSSGLGLYVSRQIVESLEGELTYHPVDHGSRFVVALRMIAGSVSQVVQSPPAFLPRREATLEGMRVLLVDDEEAIRRPLARFLNGRGAETIQAADGIDALQKLEQYEVDVILADLRMPRMDGVKMYQQLVSRYPDLAERTVFLTGDLTHMKDVATTAIDPSRILIKPVKLAEVERRLRFAWLRGSPGSDSEEPGATGHP